jgi:choline dehydrogenase
MKSFISISLLIHISTVFSLPLYAQIVGRDVELNSTYDFVILGGGLSGLTVADRLSENPSGMSTAKVLPEVQV